MKSFLRLSVLGLATIGAAAQTDVCPTKTVVANFVSGNGIDYSIKVGDAATATDPTIELCVGDTLSVTRTAGFNGHPLQITGILEDGGNFVSNTGNIVTSTAGDYEYECIAPHPNMAGIVRVLPSSNAKCQCDKCTASTTTTKNGSDGELYCVNGGTVSGTFDGTTNTCTCTCNPGYSGDNCQDADQCTGTTTNRSANGDNGVLYCINGGTVTGTTGNCLCTGCNAGWKDNGGSCHVPEDCTASTDPAKDGSDGQFYCVNGGTIGGKTDECTCTGCNTGWGGDSCDEDIDFCTVSTPTTIYVGEQAASNAEDLPHFDFYRDAACTSKLTPIPGLPLSGMAGRTYGISENTEYTFQSCTRDGMSLEHRVQIYSVDTHTDISGHDIYSNTQHVFGNKKVTLTTGAEGSLIRYNDENYADKQYGFFKSLPFQHDCQNGGACVDGNATYTCNCTSAAGYEGDYCTTDTNECTVDGGTLGDCHRDYTDACADSSTDNTIPINDYKCYCKDGWKGKDCDVSIDDCFRLGGDPAADPCDTPGVGNCKAVCKNNAQCTDGHLDFTCDCTPGWKNKTCGVSIDDCAHDPCLNNAKCIDRHLGHECDCSKADKDGKKWYNNAANNEINCDSEVVEGCMKPDKINYNELATHDYDDDKCKDGADVYSLAGYTDKKIRMGKWEKMQKRKYEKTGRADSKSYSDKKQRKAIRKNDRIAITQADFKPEVWSKLDVARPKKLEVGPVSWDTTEKCAEKATDDYVGNSDDCVTTVLDEEDDDAASGKKTLTRRVIPKAEEAGKENWQVVGKKDANDVVKPIIKQTRKFNDTYTMKCWDETSKTWNGPVLGGKTENIEEGEEFMCADTRHRVLVGGVTDYPADCVLTSCTAEQKHEAYMNRNIARTACDGETADVDRTFAAAESDESGCVTLGCTAQQLVDSFTCDV